MVFEEIITNSNIQKPKILDIGSGTINIKTTFLIDNFLNRGRDFKYCAIDKLSERQIFNQDIFNTETSGVLSSDWLHFINHWNNKEEPFTITESQFISHFSFNFGLDVWKNKLNLEDDYNILIINNLLHFFPKENWLQIIDTVLIFTDEKCEFYSEIFCEPNMTSNQVSFTEYEDLQLFSKRFEIKECKLINNKFEIVGMKI